MALTSAARARVGVAGLMVSLLVAAWQDSPNRAGVVVRFDDNRTVSRCVAFVEPSISGYELLDRAGLTSVSRIGVQGGLVCSVEGVGCPAEDCLCHCRGGGECIYWSYWQLRDEGWGYSQAGAVQRRIGHGDVDGWSWGPGTVEAAVAPDLVDFEQICGGEAATSISSGPELSQSLRSLLPFAAIATALLAAGVLLALRRSE